MSALAAGGLIPIALLVAGGAFAAMTADDALLPWPDYRGPAYDGHAPGSAAPPLKFSESQGVVWKTEIHGRGWASPVVRDEVVWLATATEEGHELSVVAVDFETGEVLVDQLLFEIARPDHRNALNSYASPSAVVDAERVYLHYGTCGTVALDPDDGTELWRREDLRCQHLMGPGSSPVLAGGNLILTLDGADVQYVVALDPATGDTVWRRGRSADFARVIPDQRKAYGTPLLVSGDEEDVLVSTGARRTVGLDPTSGEERWWVDHGGYSMSARAVLSEDIVIINTGYDRPSYIAIRLGGQGDVTESHVLWTWSKNVPTMSSAVARNGYLYFVDEGGIAGCLEIASGEQLFRARLGGQHSASPVVVGDRIHFFDREGAAVVIAAEPEFRVIAENRLDAGFMASPAVVGDSWLLRTETHLYRIGE